MDKGIFTNDGSFMERFKQMQQEAQEKKAAAASASSAPKHANPKQGFAVAANKRPFELKNAAPVASAGKLAFSLKKAKVAVAPVFAADEEDEDAVDVEREEPAKRQKSVQADAPAAAAASGAVAPPPPNDMTVRQVADKLASFVAKNGRQFENITRQRNPGDTPFKFLFDKNCPDYKYYEFQLAEEERALAQSKEAEASKANSGTASFKAPGGTYRSSFEQKSNYQTPASALYGAYEGSSSQGSSSSYGDHTAPPSDPVALMEFYAKKAALEERKRPPRQSKDEMPPPPSLQGPPKKGHHMGDFIPQEELEKFMARCEGLGSERRGRADPVMAGDVKKDHLGVGAVQPGEVTSEDDIYEQYKKRMMLGYRYRPNPLNNPRKSYY
ncbi:SURP and G-patch domain-containing protein 1-like protein [Zea mays]|uniref:SURP and G-patch domain-containing protein 1-like protein n=1 Tax=Zea mays TaxID=4577 RepID=A0A1D6IHI2_MAIZE|nr:SURP and G-patch domain-containing protein 1-like protein [Zea mays]ONM58979.1 SURP and G-patch domain-containing protein 1-like protein [Zea mays]